MTKTAGEWAERQVVCEASPYSHMQSNPSVVVDITAYVDEFSAVLIRIKTERTELSSWLTQNDAVRIATALTEAVAEAREAMPA